MVEMAALDDERSSSLRARARQSMRFGVMDCFTAFAMTGKFQMSAAFFHVKQSCPRVGRTDRTADISQTSDCYHRYSI
ncbi:MAG: hypothetical protein AUJ20_10930 [Comamonadaceae bacterium CG1_02_60_18]|nr:MAG: hypothetical protein AUJ20_10930 [Comamonadaceae bacterium CG1_02_60_18]PIQ52844.1 MAG: hypothetical protein COW02_08700 [Comamonadaceae bacterium CG12_big_fil_rev_8_21_14_0_65_59_15]